MKYVALTLILCTGLTALAADASEEDVTLLFVLLRDPEELVQAAAIRAAGERRIEATRAELLVRAPGNPHPWAVRCPPEFNGPRGQRRAYGNSPMSVASELVAART